jgi:DNA-binding NarL/FixJ family response regulator
MELLRILLADDDNLVRTGIRMLLETIADITVVGEASDGQMAWQLCQELHPDVIFLDINMPKLNGIEVASKVRSEIPQTGIVIISMVADAQHVQRAMKAGVNSYLLKNSDHKELTQAIQAAVHQETYLSPSIRSQLSSQAEEFDVLSALTSRQREILQLIAEGYTTKEIASMLSISDKTVETHRANMMERLQIFNVPELVVFAIQSGLVILNSS